MAGEIDDLEPETEIDDEAPTRASARSLRPSPDAASRPSSRPSRAAQPLPSTPPLPSSSAAFASASTSTAGSRPSSPPSGDSVLDSGSSRHSLESPREVMERQEIARTRVFLRVSILLAIVSGVALPFVGGDPSSKVALLAGLVAVLLACGWLAAKIRDDRGYTIGRAMFVAFVCITTVFLGIYFFGVWSPAVAMLPFGLFFFSQGQSARGIAVVYLTCSLGLLALMGFVGVGVLPDRGLVRGDALGGVERIIVMLLLQAVLAATFFLAKRTSYTMYAAIVRHDAVVRSLAHRDALLKEARQDLQQVLQAEGLGHFSDRTVGRWRLGRVLGRGAMGEVYEGVHVETGELAAVKLLREHLLGESVALQRFFQEAHLAASLHVENVVRVFEFSEASAPVPYIAMERLTGRDLAELLRAKKRLSPRKLIALLRQVGQGLDAARAAGIVHRDLKPRNLFCAETPNGDTWKILDFGVSKLICGESATLTRDIIGTPAYMAPEQALTLRVDHRADLFSLAVIAYRSLTGRPAFTGDSSAEVLYKIVHAMPPAPSEGLSMPAQLDAVFAIALAKEPGDRFDSGAELAQAFDAAWRGRLDASLVERARAILAKRPWGKATGGGRQETGDGR